MRTLNKRLLALKKIKAKEWQIWRKWSFKREIFSPKNKLKSPGMEPLTIESKLLTVLLIGRFMSVYVVSEYRITDTCQMYTYLMSATGKQIDFEQRQPIFNFSHESTSLGELWIDGISYGHPFSIKRISTDERFNVDFRISNFPFNHGKIPFSNRAFFYFLLERSHSSIILGDQQKSTRIFIQAMDNTRAFYPINDGKTAKMVQECVH
jgi:hypothetical protein